MGLIHCAFLVLGWLLVLAILLWTLGPVRVRPQLGHPQAERFLAYFAVSLAFALGSPQRWKRTALLVAFMAVLLEVLQIFIPGRDGRVADALVKILGAACGALAARGAAAAINSAAFRKIGSVVFDQGEHS